MLGLHLYRSVIHRVGSMFGVIPISISHSYCLYELELGPHLYRSVIVLSIWVWVFGIAPISISHLPISLFSVRVGITLISIGHHLINLSLWDRTYIDQSLSYQFGLSHWDRILSFLSIFGDFGHCDHISFIHLVWWFWSWWPRLIFSQF